jgi:hypothetical protein
MQLATMRKFLSNARLKLYNMLPLGVRNLNFNDLKILLEYFFNDVDEFYSCDKSLM